MTDNGPVLNYIFKDKRTLTLAEGNGSPVESGYGALKLQQLIFFSHMIPGTQRGFNVVIDPDTNLVTVFEVWFSSGRKEVTIAKKEFTIDDREVQREIYFGYVDVPGKEAPKKRHHTTNRLEGTGMYWKQDTGIETLDLYPSVASSNFVELTRHADELVGRGFTRSYSDQMTSMHLYTTPHSSSWTIFTANQTLGMQWCAPAIYVKLRPGVYIFDLVEEACNGAETCIIENEKTKRACGFGFSGGERGVGLNTIGAIARDIGKCDIKHFFGPNAKRNGGAGWMA